MKINKNRKFIYITISVILCAFTGIILALVGSQLWIIFNVLAIILGGVNVISAMKHYK
ncbi:hypothetical protein [Terribacillus sp. JSM ZJ617]|uniref:hypothetical protein n=1 Tax=Terribacillus TaxID=459532 RepID=UPI0035A8B84D